MVVGRPRRRSRGEVVGDHHRSVELAAAKCIAKRTDGNVMAGIREAAAFGKIRDQFPALRRLALVNNSQANV